MSETQDILSLRICWQAAKMEQVIKTKKIQTRMCQTFSLAPSNEQNLQKAKCKTQLQNCIKSD